MTEHEGKADAEDEESNPLFHQELRETEKKAEETNESAFPSNQNIEITHFALFEKHEL